ncbi:MAG: type II secretion system F family protein [Steroidobacteraceae bacterium]
MKPEWLLLMVGTCVTLAVALLALLIRRVGHAQVASNTEHGIPWPVRAAIAPAEMLQPVVALALTSTMESRHARELDSLGLAPGFPASLWLSVRCIHGAVLCAAVALLPGHQPAWVLGVAALVGYGAGAVWLRRLREFRTRSIHRELPIYLDLMTVCVEAGSTLTAGIRLIVGQSPDTPLRRYFDRVLREVRSGRPRAQAFAHVAQVYNIESLTTLSAALSAAEGAGLSLGQVLRAQATQRTAERFSRAERLAMQAPVKMLGPLILCIFPCTFIVLAVPIAVRLREALGT